MSQRLPVRRQLMSHLGMQQGWERKWQTGGRGRRGPLGKARQSSPMGFIAGGWTVCVCSQHPPRNPHKKRRIES